MFIQVRTMDGRKTHKVDGLSKLSKIEDLRTKIEELFGCSCENQRLFFRGKQLVDGHSLFDYDVAFGDMIQLLIKQDFIDTPSQQQQAEDDDERPESSASSTVTEEYSGGSSHGDEKEGSVIDNQNELLEQLFKVGTLVDVRHPKLRYCWLEGKITRVEPAAAAAGGCNGDTGSPSIAPTPPGQNSEPNHELVKKIRYRHMNHVADNKMIYHVDIIQSGVAAASETVPPVQVHLKDMRCRARVKLDLDEIECGDVVMVNHVLPGDDDGDTTVCGAERGAGYWYDMLVTQVDAENNNQQLVGTVYSRESKSVVSGCRVKRVDEVYRIERTRHHLCRLQREGERRDPGAGTADQGPTGPATGQQQEVEELAIAVPGIGEVTCGECMDNPRRKCRVCGCVKCGDKRDPDKTLLCDECDDAYHIYCLTPALPAIPEGDDDWYCPECKNDDTKIVKAGEKLKESKKKASLPSAKGDCKRDWGRGMATAGRSRSCTIVPADHFGPIPGIPVGTCWSHQNLAGECGCHRPPVAGIAGRAAIGAQSIVLSNGYEDDVDRGTEFTYTGSGGRDLSGNKRNGQQVEDQQLTKSNMALAVNCAATFNPKGADAAANWQKGKPLRVVRSYKGRKHSKYAPLIGLRYDGIYKVVKYWPQKGKSGFTMWRYLMRRDDSEPAPWTKQGKARIQELGITLQYPEGYDIMKMLPKSRKRSSKASGAEGEGDDVEDEFEDLDDEIKMLLRKRQRVAKEFTLSAELEKHVHADREGNGKLWDELREVAKGGEQSFLDKVQEVFMCIVCQDLSARPVTTPCHHNICESCLKRSFKAEVYSCPACREDLKEMKVKVNSHLMAALHHLFPSYDKGRV